MDKLGNIRWGKNHERRRNLSKLEEVDVIEVFKRVDERLSTEKNEKNISLWRKMQHEIKSGGVRSAVSWLENALKQKSEQVREKLNQFRKWEE